MSALSVLLIVADWLQLVSVGLGAATAMGGVGLGLVRIVRRQELATMRVETGVNEIRQAIFGIPGTSIQGLVQEVAMIRSEQRMNAEIVQKLMNRMEFVEREISALKSARQ